MTPVLLAGLVATVIAVNLAVAWLLVHGDHDLLDVLGGSEWQVDEDAEFGPRIDSGAGTSESRTDPPPLDADGAVVVCRHCGAENRPGYRYCRWCVRSGLGNAGTDPSEDPAATQRPL